MYLRQSTKGAGSQNTAFSVPEINEFPRVLKDARTDRGVFATLNLVEDNGASQVDVGLVTGNYLSATAGPEAIGHSFSAQDAAARRR